MQNNNSYKKLLLTVGLTAALPAFGQQCQSPTPVWEDNFDGTTLDTSKWEPMIGDGCSYGICGWGNSELQYYKAENATVANGMLTITARKERVQSKAYTSARLRTANMPNGGEWTNGRFEARVKVPDGTGMWSAFWMLPTDPAEAWPISGEIDILESVGQSDEYVFGTLHYGELYPNNSFTGNRLLIQPEPWSAGFHVYALEWEPNEMRWYVDDQLYATLTPNDLTDASYWTFEDHRYHFLLNLAVGGNLGGVVDDSMLPQTMQVDYVRVYDHGQPSITGDRIVDNGETTSYSVAGAIGGNASYSWSIPADATLLSGGNSDTVTVQWGSAGGDVNVSVSDSCGSRNLSLPVHVGPKLVQETVLDDFESNRTLAYNTFDGTLVQDAVNPQADTTNGSSTVAMYTRSAAAQYDVIIAGTSAVPDADPFLSGDKAFYMDVFTTAAPGTQILVQMEDSSSATASNYPTGRHSKYAAHVGEGSDWQRLKFELDDRIDGGTPSTAVDSLVILFDPNTLNGDTYYWDNFNIYGVDNVGNQAPMASATHGCSGLECSFDASASADSDGTIAGYQWDFGDGESGSGVTVTHTYAVAGTYTATLTVTDDQGASDQASFEVIASDAGEATTMYVSSVVTGTASAGRGQKYATATVTVLDDLGRGVPGVSVTGNFNGSISESGASGTTDSNGIAVVTSAASAGGNVSVSFCVTDLSGGLSHDTAASIGLCQ
ncbi:family 16 glycosylhydrolase [Microbulbifer salipaludis]|uniref:Family 16 glycosylhydrolase n=1 Tax=Microbulbifer salipaludis TaxID=187980 RepID=A0ABS3E3Y7_9GAMM|nr:PKD domain-containing protein [Microbulbifer salipaludis]MBN8430014.1 family 16 glycosylhydrolase [Microbulbifer salipaludis]